MYEWVGIVPTILLMFVIVCVLPLNPMGRRAHA
jgi:hypothetical protein